MSVQKTLNTRIQNKTDTTENWGKASFIPYKGELIIYQDYDADGKPLAPKYKNGDGVTPVGDLPFATAEVEIPEQIQADWNQNDTTAPDYINNKTHWTENAPGLYWEGTTIENALGSEMLQSEGSGFYKVSDDILNCLGATITLGDENGTLDTIINDIPNCLFCNSTELIYVATISGSVEDLNNTTNGAFTFVEGGTYVIVYEAPINTKLAVQMPDTEIVHKLDSKYIEFPEVENPDWLTNDPSNKSYIENRTHYIAREELNWTGVVGEGGHEQAGGRYDPTYYIWTMPQDSRMDFSKAVIEISDTAAPLYVTLTHHTTTVLTDCDRYKFRFNQDDIFVVDSYDTKAELKVLVAYAGASTVFVQDGATCTLDLPELVKKLDSKYIDDTTVAFKSDLLAFPVEGGAGDDAVQQTPRADKVTIAEGETTPHFSFTGPDEANMAGRIEYGAVGNYSASLNGRSAALNKHAFAINNSTIAKGEESFAQGYETIAEGNSSVATGSRTWAKGLASHTEGEQTYTEGEGSHAEGALTKAMGRYSHAEGERTTTNGDNSHAEGALTQTGSFAAHAEGNATIADTNAAHAEGSETKVVSYILVGDPDAPDGGEDTPPSAPDYNDYESMEDYRQRAAACAHAEGNHSIAMNYGAHAEGVSTTALGHSSHTEGWATRTGEATTKEEDGQTYVIANPEKGLGAHAEGYMTQAIANYSHAEGNNTTADGTAAHAEGTNTEATGYSSHTEGDGTEASGPSSHAEGEHTTASAEASHAEGAYTNATAPYTHAEGYRTTASEAYSHAEGENATASGHASHAEGSRTEATNLNAHAEGSETHANAAYSHAEGWGTHSTNQGAHAEGHSTWASGQYSHAEGEETKANGPYAHTEGFKTKASGASTHAEGHNIVAMADRSHAEGDCEPAAPETYNYTFTFDGTTYNGKDGAYGAYSHREGRNTLTLGPGAHAEGIGNVAQGLASHAEGFMTEANGTYSHASGLGTKANGDAQTVVGMYNKDDPTAKFIVGAGYSDNRHNAFTAGNDGTEDYITLGDIKLTKSKLERLLALLDLSNAEDNTF